MHLFLGQILSLCLSSSISFWTFQLWLSFLNVVHHWPHHFLAMRSICSKYFSDNNPSETTTFLMPYCSFSSCLILNYMHIFTFLPHAHLMALSMLISFSFRRLIMFKSNISRLSNAFLFTADSFLIGLCVRLLLLSAAKAGNG